MLNGYTSLIDGIVTFIASPEYSIAQKQTLISTAFDVYNGQIQPAAAVNNLASQSTESGKILREWLTLGINMVGVMAAVATFLLAYNQDRGNLPPEEVAMDQVDAISLREPQPDRRNFTFFGTSTRPWGSQILNDKHMENARRDATSAKSPNENRKSRRAAIKKNKSKLVK